MNNDFESPQKRAGTVEKEFENFQSGLEQAERTFESDALERQKAGLEYVRTYAETPAEKILHESLSVPADEIERIVLDLEPEDHDGNMQELIALVQEKGIKNTLAVVQKLNNPHVEDDFHRFIVEYVREGNTLAGIKEKGPIAKMLHMTLFEIVLPPASQDEGREIKLAEMLSSMEQFYAGMRSLALGGTAGQNYFALEIAIPNHHEEFIFYGAVPSDRSEFFEKHVTSSFPEARLTEIRNDYNIFNEQGVTVGAAASFSAHSIFPIKTYEQFDRDPLNSVLNSLSKVDADGEGASIQIIFNPEGAESIAEKYKSALGKLQKGVPKKEALNIAFTVGQEIQKEMKKTLLSFLAPKNSQKSEEEKQASKEKILAENQDLIALVKEKLSAPLYQVNIRLLASSRTQAEAEAILSDMQSSFNQFENTQNGKFVWKPCKGNTLRSLTRNFSFRLYDEHQAIPLNVKELTTLLHFHTAGLTSAHQLKKSLTNQAAAPAALPKEGMLIGINKVRGSERNVFMLPDDRLRHMYIIGQTGTGKSTFMKNMIIRDIQNGEGVCYIDPHGVDIQDVLASVPKERYSDVIYFDPSNSARPIGLNMLEYNPAYPEQKTFVVNELFSIFQKLYGSVPESMGPMFEQYFRNATMLVIDDPASGSTLLDVSRVLADKAYRELKLSRCKNPIVVQFWNSIASQASGEASLANIVPYITSKFDVFLANDIMRPIIAQQESAFNFRDVMDKKKILLVNLAKGKLGDINSNLIGLIFVGKILMATLSRVDAYGTEINPFYLYIDEFQNVTTDSISVILSEARKYKLSLHVAHQFIAQLSDEIRDSVFGNVGSMVSFRVGSDDAEYLEKQFSPLKAADLMNVENRNAYVKMLVKGQPTPSFSILVPPPPQPVAENLEKLKELSSLMYGRSREEVESEIMSKYRK